MSQNVAVNELVSIEHVDDVALVCIDNPPVNAAGYVVRSGLQTAIENLNAAGTVKAIAIYGAGRTFVAGADIREFGKPPKPPAMPDLYNMIEASGIPVICVLHGTALGGGLELGMATHARIGVAGLRVGLPEIALGLLPGAGGTQRAPRLVGIPVALEMILSGRQVGAEEALRVGLIDRLEAGQPRDIALRAALDVTSGVLVTRRTCDIETPPDQAALDATAQEIRAKQPHLFSPLKCVEAVAASTLPLAEGLKIERQAFMDALATPQSKGLIHAFFAERAVADIPEKDAVPRDVTRIGVIGGGTMGSGIATSALLAGYEVTLVEVSSEALARGTSTIEGNLAGAVKRGKLKEADHAATRARLSPTTELGDLADVDLVIEAVFENMDVKKQIFAKLDGICKPGAILASNTSYLNIDSIASVTKRPGDVIGMHFFSPAHVMRLLEIVVADKTAPDVVATAFAMAKRMRKIGVRAGVCDGFIGNRILSRYVKAASYLLLDGAHPQQVDDALEAFGFAMGPYRVTDLAGLDIGWAERKRKAPSRDPRERYSKIADRICENGWFGRKTGKGYYIYDDKSGDPNPEIARIIDAVRAEDGITPRTFTDQEIVERYLTAMIMEAAQVVDDGIALRPVDVDAVFLFGYGFPRFRGGPLHYADTIGAKELVRRIQSYAEEDDFYWQVPPLLDRMANDGLTFADIGKGA